MSIVKLLVLNYLCFLLLACNNEKRDKELDLGNMIAKGEIKDSIYNGKISFFDKETGKLIEVRNYVNNVLNGEYKKYYKNNKIMILGNYSNGLPNGYSYYYDNSGELKLKTFIYYNVRVGPTIEYLNNKPQKYFFYSLDNKILFEMDYDSINGKAIPEIAHSFFFINIYNINDSTNEYRIYNINPPKYDFQYKLVTIDENTHVKDTIQSFSPKDIWHTFIIHLSPSLPKAYAISLFVKDSVNGRDCVMIKRL